MLLDGVINGALDGAHMLAGQPLGATIGYGTQADIITAFSMDLNGNAITVSNTVWEQMKPHIPMAEDGNPQHPISAEALKPVIDSYKQQGKSFNMGMVFRSLPITMNYVTGWQLAAFTQAITHRIKVTVVVSLRQKPCYR